MTTATEVFTADDHIRRFLTARLPGSHGRVSAVPGSEVLMLHASRSSQRDVPRER
jgi:hypothetical protein